MKGLEISIFLTGTLLTFIACSKHPDPVQPKIAPEPPPSPKIEIPPYTGTNLIDASTHKTFFLAKHTPVQADQTTLCRRLFADLIGRFPTKAEVTSQCQNRTVLEIVENLQGRDEYVYHSQVFWRDRFKTSDFQSNWRYLKSLYALVEDLHRGELKYASFVKQTAAHPGFIMTDLKAEETARAAYRAYFGREATDAEALDLAGLYRPWIPLNEADPDIPYAEWSHAYVFPVLCQPILDCSSRLLGGETIDLRGSGMELIPYEDLKAWQIEELSAPGKLIAKQAFLWEAEADHMLNRFLSWSDGGRTPREPGIVLPELRQALAEVILTFDDYRKAEAELLTSSLYTQATQTEVDSYDDEPGAPIVDVFTSGPLKRALPEVWLNSIKPVLGIDFGRCDPRYPDFRAYQEAFELTETGTLTPSQLETELRRIHELLEHRVPILPDDDYNIEIPARAYTFLVRLIGGCPGVVSKRQDSLGIAFAFTQDYLAELLCTISQNLRPNDTSDFEESVHHQTQILYGRDASSEEVMIFQDAFATCIGQDCTADGAARSVCVALLTSAEMLFY